MIGAEDAVVIAGWCEQGRSAVRAYRGRVRSLALVADERPAELPDDVAFTAWNDEPRAALETADVVLRCPPLHPQRLHAQIARLRPDVRPRRTSATQEFLEQRGTERVIGVTGTKGKSSTAALITHVLGRTTSALMAGNCGISPLDVRDTTADWVVLELANFQTIDLELAPRHVVLRPITADHLDWHASIAEYVAAKLQLLRAQGADGIVVHDTDAPHAAAIAQASNGRVVAAPSRDLFVDDARRLRLRGRPIATLDHQHYPGRHGISNAIAAAQALDVLGLDTDAIGEGLETFRGLPHRLEHLPGIGDVEAINDSHSTSVPSTVAALRAVPGPIVLMLGGDDKRADLWPLVAAVAAAPVVACVTFGEDGDRLAAAVGGAAAAVDRLPPTAPMDRIVATALRRARAGDCLLFSPAAASGAGFVDAAARGDAFRAAVASLRETR